MCVGVAFGCGGDCRLLTGQGGGSWDWTMAMLRGTTPLEVCKLLASRPVLEVSLGLQVCLDPPGKKLVLRFPCQEVQKRGCLLWRRGSRNSFNSSSLDWGGSATERVTRKLAPQTLNLTRVRRDPRQLFQTNEGPSWTRTPKTQGSTSSTLQMVVVAFQLSRV